MTDVLAETGGEGTLAGAAFVFSDFIQITFGRWWVLGGGS